MNTAAETPEGVENPTRRSTTVLMHYILGGTSVGGLFGLIAYAINRGDRFRRLLVLIGVVVAIGAASCAVGWFAHVGQL